MPRLIILLFACNLAFAYLASSPLSGLLQEVFGDRVIIDQLLASFDYTTIMDFLNQYGVSLQMIVYQSLLFMLAYLLFSIFLSGGIFYKLSLEVDENAERSFWTACAFYFLRFCLIQLLFFICLGIVLYILYMIFMMVGLNPFTLESEQVLINRFWVLFAVAIVIVFLLIIIKDTAKLHLVRTGQMNVWKALRNGLQRALKFDMISVTILHSIAAILFLLLFLALRKNPGIMSWMAIVFGQLFVVARIYLKLIRISAYNNLLKERT